MDNRETKEKNETEGRRERSGLKTFFTVVLTAAIVFTGSWYAFGRDKGEEGAFEKLSEMQNTIREDCIWETDEQEQYDAMAKALMDSIGDEYSEYMTKEEYEAYSKMLLDEEFIGIGVTLKKKDNGDIIVVDVIEDSPASAGGIRSGDIITEIDGVKYDDIKACRKAMSGEAGSEVEVVYRRNGKLKTIKLVRADVKEQSVFSKVIDDKYGYIKIIGFNETTADQFADELSEIERKKVKGFVIDLRDNPGGYTDQAIKIADMLLPECRIISTKDAKNEEKFENSDEKCTNLKYVLLVNKDTASSAEILSAAVQGNKAGKIVGTKTFGKGIIQSFYEFDDGSAFKMTTHEYFTPDGKPVHGVGITPDYIVKQKKGSGRDLQLKKAIELL